MHWTDSFLSKWGRTRLAHEAVMVQDAAKMLRINREKLTGKAESDDEMQVGDNHYTIHGGAAKSTSALLPALGAAALGVGGTLAAMSLLNEQPTPIERTAPVVEPSDVNIPDYVIIPRAPAE